MRQLAGGVFVLLLSGLAAQAEDKSGDKPPTPRAQFDALVKEYEAAQKAEWEAQREARTPDQLAERMREQSVSQEKFFTRFVDLAEKNRTDPVAIDVLIRVVRYNPLWRGAPSLGTARKRALRLLARDHAGSAKVGDLPGLIRWDYENENESLLRALLSQNPNKDVRAEACEALVENLCHRASIARQLPSNEDLARRIEYLVGKETALELRKAVPDKLAAEAETVARHFADNYLGEVKPDRLMELCQDMRGYTDRGGEALVRALLKHDERRVRGVACLTLGQVLKQRADEVAGEDPGAAERLRGESAKLFGGAAEKYADVKLPVQGTVGQQAKGELYEVCHMVVGKPAPEVEGEDQDGKKFRLSDYKGKVVLLDFWTPT
jgi:hypothetical protein